MSGWTPDRFEVWRSRAGVWRGMHGSRMQREPGTIPPSLIGPHQPDSRINLIKFPPPERWMSGLSRTPGKRVYGESRTEGSNPSLSASQVV